MVAPYQYVNPLQKNQYVMRTTEEIQEIIDSYPDNWTKKDFRGEGKLNKEKILTRKETERPGLKFKFEGKRKFKPENLENVKRTKIIKDVQGSNISVKGSGQIGKQFSHVYPLIESAKPGTKTTFTIDASMNRKLEPYNKIGQRIAEEQELVIKTKPEGYKKRIVELNAGAKKNVMNAVKDLGKDYKGQIGYFQVDPDTGEFKPKAGNYKMSFAGIEGEDKIYKDMTGKERKDFERKISAIEKIKSEVPGIKKASELEVPEKSKTMEMFKTAFKKAPKGKVGVAAALTAGLTGKAMADEEPPIKYNDEIGAFVDPVNDEKVSQATLLDWAANNPMPTAAVASAPLLSKTVRKGAGKLLSGLLSTLGSSTAGLGFAGLTVKENLDEGKNIVDATVDPLVGAELLFPEAAKRFGGKGLQNALGRALSLGRVGAMMTPVGIGITGLGIGKELYNVAQEEQDRINAMTPEEKLEYFAEQQELMDVSA